MQRSHNAELDVFLNCLFSWDAEAQKLFKSVSWTFPLKPGDAPAPGMKPGQKPMANYAADLYGKLVQLIETRGRRPDTDVYICLGTQRLANFDKFSTDGYPKALRRQANIASYKSIWLDLDVKPGAYATTEEAYAALDQFIETVGLPPATMEVLSGSGGVHVYWCTKTAMPPEAWAPLARALRDSANANGLKFDALVTVTPTALLRIPGSFNWKTKHPRPVQLLQDSSCEVYDYAELATPLNAAAAVANVNVNIGTGTSGKTAYTANFTEGLTPPPVSIDDVADACLVVRDILDRGGNGDPEPLWNHALLLASFTTDPSDAAHRLSKGDPRYDPPATERKLAEKQAAKAANPAIGWPQCDQFNAMTQKCQACIYFANHKSPLSFASKVQPIGAQFTVRPNDELMPYGYHRDINNHVRTTIKDKDDNPVVVDVLEPYPVLDAAIDAEDGRLVIRTLVGGVPKWAPVSIHQSTQPAEAGRALATSGFFIQPRNYAKSRDFLVSWMGHLQHVKKTIAPAHYGWTDDGKGFTYDQITYTNGGEEIAYRGKTHDNKFAAHGELKPWQDAMTLVYGKPALETAVASAFAAPLVGLVAGHSVVVSVCSPESGVGKTTALQLGQAVWGNPRTGISALNDSMNSVMEKIANLASLPAYWDELKTVDQLEQVINLVFSVTQGKGKSRLTRDIQQAKTNAFTTMFVVASNHGIQDTVYRDTAGTEAGGLRVFEVGVGNRLVTTVSDWHATQLLKRIEINYGCAGAEYARYIANHQAECRALLDKLSERYDQVFSFGAKERFWRTTMVTLLGGAMIANKTGLTSFDIDAVDRYLRVSFLEQRATLKVQDYATLTTTESAKALMQELMAELRGKHLVTTNMINYVGIGKPQKVTVVDMFIDDLRRLGNVWMQVGVHDKRIRIRLRPFHEWLMERRLNPKHVLKLLEKEYVVTKSKQSIGAGIDTLDAITQVLGGRSECYDLTPLRPHGSSPGASST